MATDAISAHESDVFLYRGAGGPPVPAGTRRIRVHPSVTAIPEGAFQCNEELEVVELPPGLVEIGNRAFNSCGSLRRINVPGTVRSVGDFAFHSTSLSSLRMPDGVERIGEWTFCHGHFPTFRIPQRIAAVSLGMFGSCHGMFALELPPGVRRVEYWQSAGGCRALRNLAVPPDAEVQANSFRGCSDLRKLFRSEDEIANSLKRRFDGLPVHELLYYQSYCPVTAGDLERAISMRSGWHTVTLRRRTKKGGDGRDRLGMTPLHVLACSTVQRVELYRVIIERFPQHLIVGDGWSTLPLLYAIWSNAPDDVVKLLADSYRSIYPDFELNWRGMVDTLGRANAPTEVIQNLLDVRRSYFPGQRIDWAKLLKNLDESSAASKETFQFLIESSVSKRLDSIGLKCRRDAIAREIAKSPVCRAAKLAGVRAMLASFEAEHRQLKEAATTLELALWKAGIEESDSTEGKRCDGTTKQDDASFRRRCRVRCGADHVIENVLPFLLPDGEAPESEVGSGQSLGQFR